MSETSSLSELARFVGQSTLAADSFADRRQAVTALAQRLDPSLKRRNVGELLSVVLALSARTRRMVLPHVEIDLDVFGPTGLRAVKVTMPRR
jgi:hypothetical protein